MRLLLLNPVPRLSGRAELGLASVLIQDRGPTSGMAFVLAGTQGSAGHPGETRHAGFHSSRPTLEAAR